MRLPFLTVRTRSSDETRLLGRRLGNVILPGEILLLTGGLGSGKTTFVQGLAEGLECTERATSPTYTLMKTYEGRFPLLHVDLYRCSGPLEVADLGLEQMLEPPWVAAIEWGEKAGPLVSYDYLEIEFGTDPDIEDTRLVQFRPLGRWQVRMRTLADALRGNPPQEAI